MQGIFVMCLFSKEQEVNFLIELLTYVSEDSKNLEKVMMVIGNAIEAKYITFSYIPMSEKEVLDPEMGEFNTRLTTKVDNGTETLSFSRSGSDWISPCHLTFGIMAALITMVRNDVMDHCSEENIEAYQKFVEIMKKSAISGMDALSYSNWDKKDLE